jgi:hypothetical protein
MEVMLGLLQTLTLKGCLQRLSVSDNILCLYLGDIHERVEGQTQDEALSCHSESDMHQNTVRRGGMVAVVCRMFVIGIVLMSDNRIGLNPGCCIEQRSS